MLILNPLQGRRSLQHAKLARRERGDDADHEHARLLQRGHVK